MGAVVWINGSFSSGKTSVAGELRDLLPGSFVLDPEPLGVLIRDGLLPPELYPGDFQDVALWRSWTREAVLHAAGGRPGAVIVPMTLADPQHFDEIVGRLRRTVQVHHFTLTACEATILARERTRPDDTGGWAARTVGRVLPELAHERYREHVDAERARPAEIARLILARLEAASDRP